MKKVALYVFKLVFLVLLLFLINSRVDVALLKDHLLGVDKRWFFGSAFLYFLSLFFAAKQWQELLKLQNVNLAYQTALKYTFTGVFFNTFLPSATGGDIYRIYSLGKNKKKTAAVISATFFERVLGFCVLGVFSILAAIFLRGQVDLKFSIIVFALFFSLIAGFFLLVFSNKIYGIASKFFSTFLPTKVILLAKTFRLNTILYVKNKNKLLKFALMSVVIQTMRVFSNQFAAISLGVNISTMFYFLFIPLIGFAVTLPLTFGGIGVREYVSSELFGGVGIVVEKAVLMQTMAYIATLFVNLIGGVIFFYDQIIRKKVWRLAK